MSLVTFALVTFVFVGSPLVALNSKVTFEIYFLAIIATSLRYDERICVGVGLLAVAQYAALWAFAAFRYDLERSGVRAGARRVLGHRPDDATDPADALR